MRSDPLKLFGSKCSEHVEKLQKSAMSTESNQFRYLLQLLHDDEEFDEIMNPTQPLPGSLPRASTLQVDDPYEETYPS